MEREVKYMLEAIALSKKAIELNEGGPFGCIIVKNDIIVGSGNNRVIIDNDPTAHAEVVAIRNACKNIGAFHLDDCELFSSCEPCPMCLGAIYWARPKQIYYANSRDDAAAIGFDDSMIYQEMSADIMSRKIPMVNLCRHEAFAIFKSWVEKNDKTLY